MACPIKVGAWIGNRLTGLRLTKDLTVAAEMTDDHCTGGCRDTRTLGTIICADVEERAGVAINHAGREMSHIRFQEGLIAEDMERCPAFGIEDSECAAPIRCDEAAPGKGECVGKNRDRVGSQPVYEVLAPAVAGPVVETVTKKDSTKRPPLSVVAFPKQPQ